MQLSIEVDIKQFRMMTNSILTRHRNAIAAALLSESWRLKKEMRTYARRHPWRQAPVTPFFRKSRKSYGPWFASFTFYAVDREQGLAKLGVLDRSAILNMKVSKGFRPASSGYARNARRHAGGWGFYQTRARQKAMYAHLLSLRTRSGRARVNRARAYSMIPKVGWHYVRPRPVVEAVINRQRHRIVENLKRKYKAKLHNPSLRV